VCNNHQSIAVKTDEKNNYETVSYPFKGKWDTPFKSILRVYGWTANTY